jgi:two-component system, LytTR family, sensor kinase
MKNSSLSKIMTSKRKFWIVYHVGMLFFSIVIAMIMKYRQLGNPIDPTVAVPLFVVFFSSVNIGYLAIYIVKKSEKLDHKQLSRRFLPILVGFYICAFLIADIAVTLGVFGWYLFKGLSFSDFFSNLYKNELSFANRQFIVWLMICTIVFFFNLWSISVKRERALAEENLKYRYNTLKSQLNPHFLFNSLNTLSEIVYSDAKKADNYIQKLSGVYRYILENEEVDLVPLTDELRFVEEYFALQKERDNGKISLKIDVQNPHLYRIIPVSLQLLTENALKHNSISEENPLNINIFSKDDTIVVSNVLQRKNIAESATHTGLSNLHERVKLIMGRELVVAEENKQFIVKMPIIRI